MVDLEAINAAHQAATTGPWMADVIENVGENWLVGICNAGTDDACKQQHIVTTDGVHASELSGNPKADCHAIAALFNAWPAVYAEMLALRDKVAELDELLEDANNQRDGALYFMERNDISNDDQVTARDARQGRLAIIDWLEEKAVEVNYLSSWDMKSEAAKLRGGE